MPSPVKHSTGPSIMRNRLVLLSAVLFVSPWVVNVVFKSHPLLRWCFYLLLLVLCLLFLPLLYLFVCFTLDRKFTLQSSEPSPWDDESIPLRSISRLSFLTPAAWSVQCISLEWARSNQAPPHTSLYPDSPQVSEAIDLVIQLIIRDFVQKWHTPLSTGSESPPDLDLAPEFPHAVEATIRATLQQLLSHFKQVDLATFVVRTLLPRISQHIDSYRKAEADLLGTSGHTSLYALGSEQMDLFLAGKYEQGKLHRAVGDMSSLNTKHAEQAFLRHMVIRILEAILPQAELASAAVQVVVREVLACTILFPVIDMVCDPDFWNALLDQKVGAVIHEQKMINKLREALDKQDPGSHKPLSSKNGIGGNGTQDPSQLTTKPHKTDQRSFEMFLKNISQITSILEARRTKNDVALQIRRTKAILEKMSDDQENSAQRDKLQSYLQRLETAYSLIHHIIAQLGSANGATFSRGKISGGADPNTARAKLRDVLLNPSSLSFFMEFMDRRKRSILVQFWLIVESFKNPLEEVASDSEADEDVVASASRSPAPSSAVVKTLKEDLKLFDSTYFSSPIIKVNPKHVERARRFLQQVHNDHATALQVAHVRRSVVRAQKQVYRDMEEEDWSAFKESDLFLKAAQDLSPDPNLAAGLASSVTSLAPKQFETPLRLTESTPDFSKGLAAPSPAGRNLSAHAHLFGTNGNADFSWGDASERRPSLFSDKNVGARSKANANLDILIGGRTQHTGPDGRVPLFRNDPLFDEEEEGGSTKTSSTSSDYVEVEKMDAIQHALHSIMDEDLQQPPASSSIESFEGLALVGNPAPNPSAGILARKLKSSPSHKIATPEQTSVSDNRKSLFQGLDSGSDGDDNDNDNDDPARGKRTVNPESLQKGLANGVRVAAPGELNLRDEIQKMAEKLEKLEAQGEILEALIRKAELTGARSGEIRLLTKSRSAVQREAREIRWQRDQFEKQRSENRLIPEQTRIAINGSMIAMDNESKEYAVYLIEVNVTRPTESASHPSQSDQPCSATAGWIVGRRYSEFWTLHQALKEKFARVKALESEFPGKRLVGLVHAPFVDARKASLERYLQALVKLPVACESEELRLFLSQSPTGGTQALIRRKVHDLTTGSGDSGSKDGKLMGFPGRGFVKTLFKGMTGVAEGLDDLISIGPSMLDVVAQRLSSEIQGRPGNLLNGIADMDMVSQAMNQYATAAELREAAGAGTTYWTEPICDLFVELFELKEKNNWLRRQAIVIILQQLFGSTIERKVRETISMALSPIPLLHYISTFKNGLWPNGQLKSPTLPRTQAEKEALRDSANRKLSTLIPELAANFIGRENARRGTRRIFSALQNKRLNKHLVYTILEMAIDEILTS